MNDSRGERSADPRPETEPPRPGARLTLDVHDLTAEGAGVARHGRFVVFVPGAVPGDRVVARIERVHRGFAEGELFRIEVPSAARREPPCPHQPACGGCPLMVLGTADALAFKAQHLEQTLRRIGKVEHALDGVVASPRDLAYRGRVRFAVAPRHAGVPAAFGYRPRGSGADLVPVETCLLAPARASELAREFLGALDRALPLDEPGWPEQLDVRGSLAAGAWLLVVHVEAGVHPALAGVARDLVARLPDLAGVVAVPSASAREERLLAGRDSVVERIGAAEVELAATTFLQVNPGAAELLYAEVAEALALGESIEGAGPRVLDLYCGAGLVGLLATAPGTRVVGAELHRSTVERARRAAERAGRPELEYVVAEASRCAADLARAGERFDRVVLNPPRQGAGAGLAADVRALGPAAVVIVSCHPAALARDLALFANEGFVLERLVAVDMFPQTPHLEAVARLVPRAES